MIRAKLQKDMLSCFNYQSRTNIKEEAANAKQQHLQARFLGLRPHDTWGVDTSGRPEAEYQRRHAQIATNSDVVIFIVATHKATNKVLQAHLQNRFSTTQLSWFQPQVWSYREVFPLPWWQNVGQHLDPPFQIRRANLTASFFDFSAILLCHSFASIYVAKAVLSIPVANPAWM